jgi:glyoxylase-like metal-dependent hydrolase (beta-lactamase superfamily II)
MTKKISTSTLKKVFQRNKSSSPPGDSSTDNEDGIAPRELHSTNGAHSPHPSPHLSAAENSSISTGDPDGAATPRNANSDEAFPVITSKQSPPPTMTIPAREQQMDLAYETLIPTLPIHNLPRGGVSIQTQACGYVQFGIPPETIKDSMKLGLEVPSVYIVPVDRFCREMGPALGVNLAEFEFPAYFNFFVQRRKCTLVVDSVDAERNIRKVFTETLLGPAQFRVPEKNSSESGVQDGADLDVSSPLPSSVNALGIKKYEEEDFAPDFPREAIPDFYKELQHFRIMPNGQELVLETLLKFCHFESAPDSDFRDNLGSPPQLLPKVSSSNSAGAMENGSVVTNNTDGPDDAVNADSNDTSTTATSKNKGKKEASKSLTYNQIRWIGDVAKIYPSDAPSEQIAANKTKRVEIFKMPSGTDYILHDIDENNVIVGKVRFSGNVQVSEGISVIGLDGYDQQSFSQRQLKLETESTVSSSSDGCEDDERGSSFTPFSEPLLPPTFNPPSFGVTVLGNSHGFDKSGSTSGYVLWINGRGVMIDPPPYSSATLEREGIRPRTIVGIILTHCHADHDAGAFQKVLTGSPVVVITTPTIYKSFIRKYAALSSLSPALLKHSHRYKPAVIGEPLKFQGATFHFTYTLHSIPCVGFRVDWRGRSMVFTGDHFNNPPALEKLVEKGVLSKQRAADLNHLPVQETDLLLHEAGAPPIHTPLDVLMKLPLEVRKRLYVVHTSALPDGCELRVAPTGTAGTIRLDRIRRVSGSNYNSQMQRQTKRPSIFESNQKQSPPLFNLEHSIFEDVDEYAEESELFNPTPNMYAHLEGGASVPAKPFEPPPVSLRPTSSSDAWFILNLLSAVPFLSSLSYTTTMEVLETARVVAYCCDEVVLAAARRKEYLVVVWEGTCVERETSSRRRSLSSQVTDDGKGGKAVWYAGDWTGPRVLQPEKRLSGDSSSSATHDVVAMSAEGVKVSSLKETWINFFL